MDFVPKLLKVTESCFSTIQNDDNSDLSEGKLSYLEAFKFLNMLYKILPRDQNKLKRITLKKTIPNLIKLSEELEKAQKM